MLQEPPGASRNVQEHPGASRSFQQPPGASGSFPKTTQPKNTYNCNLSSQRMLRGKRGELEEQILETTQPKNKS